MSTSETRMALHADISDDGTQETLDRRRTAGVPRRETSIVPADSIAGHALVAVIAIMSFLAAVTLGAVVLVRGAAIEWQAAVAREVTIQVRPQEGRTIDADVGRAADVARNIPGVLEVRSFSKDESTRLLEPWLGSGLALADLPVPRIIVIKLDPDAPPNLSALRKKLSDRVPNASLDDHRAWVERMRAMTATAVLVGIAVLALVISATMLSVMFATRGAMSTNRPVVEVLHFVGARDSFIAAEFQRHFLLLGLKGGALGGGAAMLAFFLVRLARDFLGGREDGEFTALFGSFSLGLAGYGAILGLVVLIAAVTAGTSRLTVKHTLRSIE